MGGSQSKKKAVEQVRSEYGWTHTGARHYMGYAITEEGDYVYDEEGNYVFADGVTYAVDEYSGEYMVDETGNYVLAGLDWDYVDAPLTPRSAKKAEKEVAAAAKKAEKEAAAAAKKAKTEAAAAAKKAEKEAAAAAKTAKKEAAVHAKKAEKDSRNSRRGARTPITAPERSGYGWTHTGARHYMGYAITEEGDYVYDEEGNYVFADGVTYAVDEYSGEYMVDETGNYVLAGLDWDYVDAPAPAPAPAPVPLPPPPATAAKKAVKDVRQAGKHARPGAAGAPITAPEIMLSITCARRAVYESHGVQGFFFEVPTSALQPVPYMYVQAHKVGPGPREPAKGAGQQVTVTFLSSYAPGYKRDYIEKHVAPDPEAAYLTNQQYESMQGYDGDNGAAPVAADGGGYELPSPEEDPNGYPDGYEQPPPEEDPNGDGAPTHTDSSDERRLDASDGCLYTRQEFEDCYGADWEAYWAAAPPEKRIDASDGCAYTRQEFEDCYGADWEAHWTAAPPS